MLRDQPRTVFVVSPQPWNGFKVSKHHYAVELAQLGHEVYFIEPPVAAGAPGAISIKHTEHTKIKVVSYRTLFPRKLKFHLRSVFELLMFHQARRLCKVIGRRPDIVWDFDNSYQFADLRAFGASLSMFHPVDDLAPSRRKHKHADIVLTLSGRYSVDMGITPERVLQVPHGLNRAHADYARRVICGEAEKRPSRVRPQIAYVGNLDHPLIDWGTMLEMARRRPDADFVFVGPFTTGRGNEYATTFPETKIRSLINCRLAGRLPIEEVVQLSNNVDVWIICLYGKKEHDGYLDSHKLLEYLATGKVILSTRVAAYAGSYLIQMPLDHTNDALPAMLDRILETLPEQNSFPQRKRRCEFALEYIYERNIERIADHVERVQRRKGTMRANAYDRVYSR